MSDETRQSLPDQGASADPMTTATAEMFLRQRDEAANDARAARADFERARAERDRLRAENEALAKLVALAADAYDGTYKLEHADRDAMRALVGGRGLLFDEQHRAWDAGAAGRRAVEKHSDALARLGAIPREETP